LQAVVAQVAMQVTQAQAQAQVPVVTYLELLLHYP